VDPEYRPFCSERCKMADLGRWLTGDYRIPGAPAQADAPGEESEDDDADIADQDR
jgi:hypothetical protein